MALEWYILNSGSENEFEKSNYSKSSSQPPTGCDGSPDYICAIEANEDGLSGKPDILGDSALIVQMGTARGTGTVQSRVLIRGTR